MQTISCAVCVFLLLLNVMHYLRARICKSFPGGRGPISFTFTLWIGLCFSWMTHEVRPPPPPFIFAQNVVCNRLKHCLSMVQCWALNTLPSKLHTLGKHLFYAWITLRLLWSSVGEYIDWFLLFTILVPINPDAFTFLANL